jgi:hypothetical protein
VRLSGEHDHEHRHPAPPVHSAHSHSHHHHPLPHRSRPGSPLSLNHHQAHPVVGHIHAPIHESDPLDRLRRDPVFLEDNRYPQNLALPSRHRPGSPPRMRFKPHLVHHEANPISPLRLSRSDGESLALSADHHYDHDHQKLSDLLARPVHD